MSVKDGASKEGAAGGAAPKAGDKDGKAKEGEEKTVKLPGGKVKKKVRGVRGYWETTG